MVMPLTKVKALAGWFVVPCQDSSLSCLNVPQSLTYTLLAIMEELYISGSLQNMT